MRVQSRRLNFDMLQEMQHLACSLKLLFEFNQHVKERLSSRSVQFPCFSLSQTSFSRVTWSHLAKHEATSKRVWNNVRRDKDRESL